MYGGVSAGMGDLPSWPDYESQQQVAQATSAGLHSNQQGRASQQSADVSQDEIVLIGNQSWMDKGLQKWIFEELLKHRHGNSQLEVRTSNFKYSEISQRKLDTSDPHECARKVYIVDKKKSLPMKRSRQKTTTARANHQLSTCRLLKMPGLSPIPPPPLGLV